MQYIDASMVGRLGKEASASIGLVASSTWLFNGLCHALMVGFSVMVAQRIGAGDQRDARNLTKQALLSALGFGLLLAAIGLRSSAPFAAGGCGSLPRRLRLLSYFCPFPAFRTAEPSVRRTPAGQRQYAYPQHTAGADVRTGCAV